jgi:DNA polymerase bacteriophage-type
MHEPLSRRSAAAALAQHVLHRDYETRSRAILKNVGTHKYAADPSTEILCAAYAVDHDPVQLWLPGNTLPPEFLQAALDPSWIVCAHNAGFEAAIEQRVLAPQFGWPLIPLERHRCTMAMALAAGLPARLSAVADALELSNRKDDAGERLMHQMLRLHERDAEAAQSSRGVRGLLPLDTR